MPTKAAMRGVLETLLDAKTSGESTPIVVPISFTAHTFYIKGNGAVSAGAIQIRMADDPTYAGLWAPFGAAVTVVANGETIVNLVGPIVLNAIKVEISTAVVGGTVTVLYMGG